ncbi:Hpt domain-containing protein [Rhizobium sp. AN80A]|uniref:Hpt domain-containing protein n=1 Tax=Rhizobium sp. AN80A TaxID=3040673 RepID=UPI0024B35353|nr:Hpt domain-containing protein [Rhizobium sp. AN80A]
MLILSSISNALHDDDTRNLDRMLHSLKGAASNVGFQDIADMAQRLRQAPLINPGELLVIMSAVDEQRRLHAA